MAPSKPHRLQDAVSGPVARQAAPGSIESAGDGAGRKPSVVAGRVNGANHDGQDQHFPTL
jgi:hypothetical protein